MTYINEIVPNPSGSDSGGEWIELFNSGADRSYLDGWFLVSKDGKKFSLAGKTIEPNGYLLLPRAETKLTLQNKDGAVALYDFSGRLAHEAIFLGTAPEGKSFARRGDGTFIFADPTPDAANVFPQVAVAAENFSFGQLLNLPLGTGEFFAIMFGGAAVLAGLALFIVKKNEDISKLFFGRD